jgi:hypothetical protein
LIVIPETSPSLDLVNGASCPSDAIFFANGLDDATAMISNQ